MLSEPEHPVSVPTERAPSPPDGYAASKIGRGLRPQHSQIGIALKTATELRSATDYAEQFGTGVPAATAIADSLTTASGWSAARENAKGWYDYVCEQETLAWRHALGLAVPLKTQFDFRVARDAAVADRYPSTASFLGVGKARAAKGVATKKKKKKKDAAAATTAGKSPAAAPAPAVTPVIPDLVKSAAVKLLN